MATTSRQTAIFGVEDWKRIYQTYQEADFQSYDFETLRKSFIDYLRVYYPETFNDYIESSEFIALLDVMAFMGQSLAFRTDLNTRENYLDTAERRDSVVRLANLVSYTPKRNTEAQGYLKVFSVSTTENVVDYNGINLANITVNWADPTNLDWQEQFTTILNAALVNTQRFGNPGNRQNILGIDTQEYTINLVPGFLPVIPYTATIDTVNMPFEVVTATSAGEDFVYEPAPLPDGQFNVLFRNDQQGFLSGNTGFFFLFKQGILQNQDFNLAERITNRAVAINIEGINNSDVWLYQLDDLGNVGTLWEKVQSVYAAAVEQLAPGTRDIYSVSSRTNDQITLNFGDGVFATIPVGTYRAYVRASNGLTYTINPVEMQSVSVPISYVSRTGQIETITFTCGITEPVTNAQARETIQEIKQRAPAQYYTQNRMVNGEDYNNFPYTQYTSILKSTAINRASIGTSRYLDLVDPTGKYSSTDIVASDGALYESNNLYSFQFSWLTSNDISDAVINQINPLALRAGLQQFYYANFPRPSLSVLNYAWNQSTSITNETTGYFENDLGNPVAIGTYASNNGRYITEGSLVEFAAPTGYFFDATNRLVLGQPTNPDEKLTIWASPLAVYLAGTGQGLGNLPSGEGPVVLNNFVPTGAIPTQVIPVFTTDIPITVQQSVVAQISLNQNFGLGYNNLTDTWYVITASNLAINASFSQTNAQSTSGTNADASWLIQATYDGATYTVVSRSLEYYFGSVLQTRFFFYTSDPIYDSRTGTVIRDYINVLKVNSQPDTANPMGSDNILTIIDQPVLSDGLVDDFQVVVSYARADNLTPVNPDFFDDIVAPTVDANDKLVFFQLTQDFDNLQRYLLIEAGIVNSDYPTLAAIQAVQSQFVTGQVFYAYNPNNVTPINYSAGTFYVLGVDSLDNPVLTPTQDYLARVGRQDLYFQYRHNSPLTSRIDPGSTNIIDVYIVTNAYYTAYINWLQDTTGVVTEPTPPTIDDLTTAYQGLQNYKMISDNMILNTVDFQPLFGQKADPALRATIKVIRAPNSTASVSTIKNLVVANMNAYFNLENWNFGDTFFFSELAAYLHQNIGGVVSSVVLVPLSEGQSFGDLYEIRSAPNQIFVNGATVNDVEVITALTTTNLRSTSQVSGLNILLAAQTTSTVSNAGTASSGSSSGGTSSGGGGSYSSGGSSGGGGGSY